MSALSPLSSLSFPLKWCKRKRAGTCNVQLLIAFSGAEHFLLFLLSSSISCIEICDSVFALRFSSEAFRFDFWASDLWSLELSVSVPCFLVFVWSVFVWSVFVSGYLCVRGDPLWNVFWILFVLYYLFAICFFLSVFFLELRSGWVFWLCLELYCDFWIYFLWNMSVFILYHLHGRCWYVRSRRSLFV